MSKTKKAEQLDAFPAERPFVRTPYNYDKEKASKDAGLDTGEGKTHQSFKDEADINTIVKRFMITGQMPEARMPSFGDFTGVNDFRTAVDAVLLAEKEFLKLPGRVRARFGNDPQNMMEFLSDLANEKEAQELGLMKKPEVQVPDLAKETPKEGG